MSALSELRTSLLNGVKECEALWHDNKDLQAQFINDLSELQRIQNVMSQLEGQSKNGVNEAKSQHALPQVKQTMNQLQQKAAILYQNLIEKRQALLIKLNEGVQQVALLQNDLINNRLLDWKKKQKLAQIGVPFDKCEEELDGIQSEFETLADHNWQLRTYASWLLDLLRRGPQLADNNAQQCQASLTPIVDNLTKLLWMLVSQSFVVSEQPDAVLKTQHKFTAEVRLLIGDRLGVKQQLEGSSASVTVRIIAEEHARQLHANEIQRKHVTSGVGTISNDFENLQLDDKGHFCARFSNSKLSRIAHRKPPSKQSEKQAMSSSVPGSAATDQKYALLFHISPFRLVNLGEFEVWTLSLPLMVTVHGSQDCDAQATILWQRAFGDVHWTVTNAAETQVTWSQLGEMLRHKFQRFTGVNRSLSEKDSKYLCEKLLGQSYSDLSQAPPISFQRFAKQSLRDDVSFSFWEWFFSVMQLVKQKLLVFWDEGWLVGFISKPEASLALVSTTEPTFLLRFSDTVTGAISIGFVCQDELNTCFAPFHLSPFTVKELDQLSLPQRIATCPQLKEIKWLYPNIDKEDVLRRFEMEERNRSPPPAHQGGYIGSEVIMVAKTGKAKSTSGGVYDSMGSAANSPATMLCQQLKIDGSPSFDAAIYSALMEEQSDATSTQSPATSVGFGVASVGVGAPTGVLDDSFELEQLLGPNFLLANFNVDPNLPQLDLGNLLDGMPPYPMETDYTPNSV